MLLLLIKLTVEVLTLINLGTFSKKGEHAKGQYGLSTQTNTTSLETSTPPTYMHIEEPVGSRVDTLDIPSHLAFISLRFASPVREDTQVSSPSQTSPVKLLKVGSTKGRGRLRVSGLQPNMAQELSLWVTTVNPSRRRGLARTKQARMAEDTQQPCQSPWNT